MTDFDAHVLLLLLSVMLPGISSGGLALNSPSAAISCPDYGADPTGENIRSGGDTTGRGSGNTLVSDDLIDGNDFGSDARTTIPANETTTRSTD